MNISKRKVVSLNSEERNTIDKVIELLDELEDELEGEYDYSWLKNELEEVRYKEYVIEDENFEND